MSGPGIHSRGRSSKDLRKLSRCSLIACCLGVFAASTRQSVLAQATTTLFKFSFGSGKPERGHLQVLPADAYTKARGYGFVGALPEIAGDPKARKKKHSSVCSDGKPFLFAVDVPEGNYDVAVTLGDQSGESTTTLKAEARRLILENVHTAPGKFETRSFTVNVRHSQLRSGDSVRLKRDEQPHLDWDDQLTLEFNNARPCVRSLDITLTTSAITVYIAGDSTVTDQGKEPWTAWGQMLPRFFKQGVAIANHAESGESLKSFVVERRLEKILETIHAGDYLFIQFAHNDQKPGASHVEASTTYKEMLKLYIDEARKRKAIPVLVTSMNRRKFDAEGRIVNTLEEYPEAMRELARQEDVALIDLNEMSKKLFEALGPSGTLKAFVHYPAGTFPGQEQELKDDTHFNSYGAYELARCVVEGIKAHRLGLTRYLADDVGTFDPSHPDSLASWHLPPSPASTERKPEGN